MCHHGHRMGQFTCPGGTLFSSQHETCDWKGKVVMTMIIVIMIVIMVIMIVIIINGDHDRDRDRDDHDVMILRTPLIQMLMMI